MFGICNNSGEGVGVMIYKCKWFYSTKTTFDASNALDICKSTLTTIHKHQQDDYDAVWIVRVGSIHCICKLWPPSNLSFQNLTHRAVGACHFLKLLPT
jgi:hypothetical protein